MKVTDKTHSESMDGTGKTQATKRKTPASSSTSVTGSLLDGELGSAKVKLSDRVQDMKKIREAVDKTPDVDEGKVAKYKSMLARGEYKVDAEKVADKMVDEHAYDALLTED